MQLVVIETAEENEKISEFIEDGNVYGAWTGGRKCRDDGCLTSDGDMPWVWESVKRLFETTFSNWSNTGGMGMKQPDALTGKENCAAVLNNWYQDGTRWHDLECGDQLPFICEDRDKEKSEEK